MIRFGELIRKIKELQPSTPVYFLAENTILRNAKEKPLQEGDLEQTKLAFDIDWAINVDSRDHSPCCRLRTYISNIPLSYDTQLLDFVAGKWATPCLDDDYKMAATISKLQIETWANCFMASKSRIDDDRMLVFKEKRKNAFYFGRPFSIREREVSFLRPCSANLLLATPAYRGLFFPLFDSEWWAFHLIMSVNRVRMTFRSAASKRSLHLLPFCLI